MKTYLLAPLYLIVVFVCSLFCITITTTLLSFGSGMAAVSFPFFASFFQNLIITVVPALLLTITFFEYHLFLHGNKVLINIIINFIVTSCIFFLCIPFFCSLSENSINNDKQTGVPVIVEVQESVIYSRSNTEYVYDQTNLITADPSQSPVFSLSQKFVPEILPDTDWTSGKEQIRFHMIHQLYKAICLNIYNSLRSLFCKGVIVYIQNIGCILLLIISLWFCFSFSSWKALNLFCYVSGIIVIAYGIKHLRLIDVLNTIGTNFLPFIPTGWSALCICFLAAVFLHLLGIGLTAYRKEQSQKAGIHV